MGQTLNAAPTTVPSESLSLLGSSRESQLRTEGSYTDRAWTQRRVRRRMCKLLNIGKVSFISGRVRRSRARIKCRGGSKSERRKKWRRKEREEGHTDELCDSRSCRRADIAGMTSNDGHCMIWSNAKHIAGTSGLSRSWTNDSCSAYYI